MRKGFSLLELLIAVTVLAIGLLAVLGSMTYGSRTAEQGTQTLIAAGYARRLIDLVRVRNLAFSESLSRKGGPQTPLDAPPFEFDLPHDPAYTRSIRVEPRDSPDLVKITVAVYWHTTASQERSTQLEAYCRRR